MVAVGPRTGPGSSIGSVTKNLLKGTPMSATTIPITHRKKSRTIPVTIGAALATIGSVVALAGGGVLAAAGDDGTIGSGGKHEISTPTAALVSSTATIEDTRDIASALGQPRIGIDADAKQGGSDVFVGIARAADVDRYLAGAEIDRVTDVEVAPFELAKRREGRGAVTQGPASQDFWVAQSSGRHAQVDWKVKDGDYRAVVMNADASRGVAADSHFEAGIPYLSTMALAAMLAGILTLAGGIVLIARNTAGPSSTATVVRPPAPMP